MKIAVSTDTSSTINLELAKKLGIHVFPLNVIINGEEFLDGVSINQDKLNTEMRAGKVIKTSTPPPMDVINYFTKLFDEGYDRVIHFTISSKLSSMNNLFNNISNDYFEGKVIVIDAYSVATVMLSHVLLAYEEVNKGTSIEDIKTMIEARKNNDFLCFVPENLTALKNGGRISPAVAALGNMIGLKPVLMLKDGALEKDTMTRNVKKTLSEHITQMSLEKSIEEYDYLIASFDGNEDLINYLIKEINKHFPDYHVPVEPIAINVCAHAGPGTISFIVTPRINGESINKYLNK